jgi:ribosomal protein S18 acetylase RimI-like enzyme
MKTRYATSKDLKILVNIHLERFSNFFLSTLGRFFLTEFYRGFLKKPGLLIVLEDNREVVGFAAGSFNNQGFFKKLLLNNIIGFFKSGIVIFFSSPLSIIRLGNNASKSNKEICNFAELLSIATINNKKGYGKILLSKFEQEIKNNNKLEILISLTTDYDNNEKVIEFYKNSGYEIFREFKSYNGRKMYRFIKKII